MTLQVCGAPASISKALLDKLDYTLTKQVQIMGKYNEFITL